MKLALIKRVLRIALPIARGAHRIVLEQTVKYDAENYAKEMTKALNEYAKESLTFQCDCPDCVEERKGLTAKTPSKVILQ